MSNRHYQLQQGYTTKAEYSFSTFPVTFNFYRVINFHLILCTGTNVFFVVSTGETTFPFRMSLDFYCVQCLVKPTPPICDALFLNPFTSSLCPRTDGDTLWTDIYLVSSLMKTNKRRKIKSTRTRKRKNKRATMNYNATWLFVRG